MHSFEKTIAWILRLTVALQCLGNARWFLAIEETPLLAQMWGHPEVGGWGWSESSALLIEHGLGWGLLLAAGLVLVRPCAWVCGPLAIVQLVIALAIGRMHPGYFAQVDWLSPQMAFLLTLATQSARIAAPLGLMILDPWRATRPLSSSRWTCGITLMRWAIAITFFAHGLEAYGLYSQFTDLSILGIEGLTGWRMSQRAAEVLLVAIGVVDMVVAVMLLVTRLPSIAFYMAFWGLVTAESRLLAFGAVGQWHELATRAAHFGIPIVLALYWRHTRNNSSFEGTLNEMS